MVNIQNRSQRYSNPFPLLFLGIRNSLENSEFHSNVPGFGWWQVPRKKLVLFVKGMFSVFCSPKHAPEIGSTISWVVFLGPSEKRQPTSTYYVSHPLRAIFLSFQKLSQKRTDRGDEHFWMTPPLVPILSWWLSRQDILKLWNEGVFVVKWLAQFCPTNILS